MADTHDEKPSEANNLARWLNSGEPSKWIKNRSGRWSEEDWASLLERLRSSDFWPMKESEIRLHISARAWRFLQDQQKETVR
jgi:hypothetical protein